MKTITGCRESQGMVISGLVEITNRLSSNGSWQHNIKRSLEVVGELFDADVVALGASFDGWRVISSEADEFGTLAPVLYENYALFNVDREESHRISVSELGTQTIFLPVISADAIIGVLCVERRRLEPFDQEDINVLSVVAGLVGAFLAKTIDAADLDRSLRDIQRLSDESERHLILVETIPDHVQFQLAYLNKNFDFLWVNDAYAADSGCTKDQMLGQNYFDFVTDEQNRVMLEEVLCTGRRYESREQPHVSRLHPERGVTYWNSSVNCVRDSEGTVQGIVISRVDVTDDIRSRQEIAGLRLEAERRAEELAASEERVVNIIESVSDGFVVLDTDWQFSFVNNAAELLLKQNRNALLGRHIWQTLPRMVDSRFHEACRRAMFEQVVVTVEDYLPWLDAWFEYKISPSSDGLLISFRDITERRRAEEARCLYLGSLGALVGVSAKVLAETTVTGLLKSVLDAALELTDATVGMSAFNSDEEVLHVRKLSVSGESQTYRTTELGSGWMSEAVRDVICGGKPVRLSRKELADHSALLWLPSSHPSLDGLLGAPLAGYDDRPKGMIAVSGKSGGEFTSEDEALLTQLAMIASLGLKHIQARDSAEKRAEEAEESRRILDALIEHVPEGIVIADGPDIKVRMASRYVREATGCANETWDNAGLFKSLWSLYKSDGVTPAQSNELPLTRAARDGEVVTGEEWMFYRPNGEPVTILCNAGPIKDRDGNVAGGVVAWRDITALRSAREGLKKDLETKRHIADTLQGALIPSVEIDLERLSIRGNYKAAINEVEVGGDFFDVFETEDNKLALVMGDVSGKGLEAAVHTAAAKYMLRAYAHQNPEPSYVLERLNNALCEYTPECLFVTIFYALIDLDTCELVYTSAGHDEPLHYDSRQRRVIPLDVTGRAVGIIPHSKYSERVLKLDAGDILLIYTDGVSDARSQGRFFGTEGLAEVLISNAHQDERTIADTVLTRASDFAGGHLKDDAAILVVKAKSGVD